MKFGKEFVLQMVAEWEEAYMNYESLKSILKEISKYKAQNQSTARRASTSTSKGSLRRRLTLYRAYSGLNDNHRESSKKNEDEVILIQSVEGEDSKGFYQTMFLRASDDGAEKDLEFFKKLDFEFNKVNAFYKKMVKKVVDEAEELSKQINYLIAFRIKVEKIGFTNLDSNETSSNPFTHHLDEDDAKHGKPFSFSFLFCFVLHFCKDLGSIHYSNQKHVWCPFEVRYRYLHMSGIRHVIHLKCLCYIVQK